MTTMIQSLRNSADTNFTALRSISYPTMFITYLGLNPKLGRFIKEGFFNFFGPEDNHLPPRDYFPED